MLIRYFIIFCAALIVSLVATEIVRRVALRFNILDQPGDRKIHIDPIPYLGGVAILIALASGYFLMYRPMQEMVWILIFGTIVSFAGLIDDIWTIKPSIKLFFQIVIASAVFLYGIKVSLTGIFLINYLLTIFWIVAIINAMNLLDNMDGLSIGVAGIASFFFFVIAAINGQFLVASLSIALSGACLGFLFFNFYPAQIFMGDAGSTLLGFVLAVIGIKLRFTNVETITFGVPILVLGIPIFDTTLVILSRLRHKISIFTAGKDHCSHRLVKLGFRHWQAVIIIYLFAMGLGGLALVLASANYIQAIGILASLVFFIIAVLIVLLNVNVYQETEDVKQKT